MSKVQAYLPQSRIVRSGESYIHFSGTNYLGTATDASLNVKFAEGTARYGSYISTSRASNISFGVFAEADQYIAKWIGTEGGLVFSSGFAACQTLLKVLTAQGAELSYAPGVHPANWRSEADETKGDLTKWTARFVEEYKQRPRPVVLFYKPIDPLGLRPISMAWLQQIPKENELLLVLDDSHMLGLCGEKGAGIYADLRQEAKYSHIRCLMVGSLSKGMGLPAGYLAGERKWRDAIASSPFYLGASMPSAAAMYVLLHAEADYARLRARLQAHISRFCEGLKAAALLDRFRYLPRYPIFLCQEAGLYAYLLKKGICIAHFSYPRPDDKPQTRIVLQGAHSEADIDKLLQGVIAFFKEN